MKATSTWKRIAQRVGPLRYQTSMGNCVPTTIINGLLVIYQREIPATLVRLIEALAVDSENGTGVVCTGSIAHLINTWFLTAHEDAREDGPVGLESLILRGEQVKLGEGSEIHKTLESGGVCCLTIKSGAHYVLLLGGDDDGNYLVFDPAWESGYLKKAGAFGEYYGLVNEKYTPRRLSAYLKHPANKYIHVLRHKLR